MVQAFALFTAAGIDIDISGLLPPGCFITGYFGGYGVDWLLAPTHRHKPTLAGPKALLAVVLALVMGALVISMTSEAQLLVVVGLLFAFVKLCRSRKSRES